LAIRRAVLPVAGLGTRFLPATKALPKEMLPLIDRPVIHFVVEEVAACGIHDVLMVTGRHKRAIEDYFDSAPELQAILASREKDGLASVVEEVSSLASFHFVRQRRPNGLGDAVLAAQAHVGEEPFALLLPDEVIRATPPALAQALDIYEQVRCCVVAVEEVPPSEVKRYGIVRPAREACGPWFRCADIVEKPDPEDAPSNLAIVGRYILTPDIFPRLHRLGAGAGGEIQLTDALASLAREGRVVAHRVQGVRWDAGEPAGLLKSSILYAMERPALRADLLDFMERVIAQERDERQAVACSGGYRPVPR
jgi:UTP--glucose-1-phosphate uridylyltransferase